MQVLLTELLGGHTMDCGARIDRNQLCPNTAIVGTQISFIPRLALFGQMLYWRIFLLTQFSLQDYFDADTPALDIPHVSIHGKYDRLFPVDDVRKDFQALTNTCAKAFVQLNTSSHNIWTDDPVALETLIRRFAPVDDCDKLPTLS